MATIVTRSSGSSQGLFLLALVLLAFSAIPAPISGQNIDGRKSKMMVVGDNNNNKAIIHGDIDGCHINEKPHDSSSLVCCSKDNLCWPSGYECRINCPCKINCGG